MPIKYVIETLHKTVVTIYEIIRLSYNSFPFNSWNTTVSKSLNRNVTGLQI